MVDTSWHTPSALWWDKAHHLDLPVIRLARVLWIHSHQDRAHVLHPHLEQAAMQQGRQTARDRCVAGERGRSACLLPRLVVNLIPVRRHIAISHRHWWSHVNRCPRSSCKSSPTPCWAYRRAAHRVVPNRRLPLALARGMESARHSWWCPSSVWAPLPQLPWWPVRLGWVPWQPFQITCTRMNSKQVSKRERGERGIYTREKGAWSDGVWYHARLLSLYFLFAINQQNA